MSGAKLRLAISLHCNEVTILLNQNAAQVVFLSWVLLGKTAFTTQLAQEAPE